MLVHNKRIVHEYLMWAMCGKPRPPGSFDLYAVECGTEAIRCFFKSLKAHRLRHDRPWNTTTFTTISDKAFARSHAAIGMHMKLRNRLGKSRRIASIGRPSAAYRLEQ